MSAESTERAAFEPLQAVERHLGWATAAESATYRRFGRWWIRAEARPWVLARKLRSVAGIHPWPRPKRLASLISGQKDYRFSGDNELTGVIGPFLAAPFAQDLQVELVAAAVWSFGYIVAFYPEHDGVCVKIATVEAQRQALQAEAENQQRVAEHTADHPEGVSTPDVLRTELEFEHPYFVQRAFQGAGLATFGRKKQAMVGARVFGFLTKLYERVGIEHKALAECWPVLTQLQNAPLATAENNPAIPELLGATFRRLKEIAQPLVEKNAELPCSLVHGDANMKNILLGPHDKVAIIDWGAAGHGPLVRDLSRCMRRFHNPGLARRAGEYLDEVSKGYSVEEQLFLFHLAHGSFMLGSLIDTGRDRSGSKHASDERLLEKVCDSFEIAGRYISGTGAAQAGS